MLRNIAFLNEYGVFTILVRSAMESVIGKIGRLAGSNRDHVGLEVLQIYTATTQRTSLTTLSPSTPKTVRETRHQSPHHD